MITPFEMYLLVRLDGIRDTVHILLPLTIVAALLSLCAFGALNSDGHDDDDRALAKRIARFGKTMVAIFSISLAMHALVPTTKEMAAIKVIPAIVNSEKVQNIGSAIYDLATEWMEELKPPRNNASEPAKEEKNDTEG